RQGSADHDARRRRALRGRLAPRRPRAVSRAHHDDAVQQGDRWRSAGVPIARGYVHVAVDVRGQGSSGGTWCNRCEIEQMDGYEVVQWAAAQAWSDGNVGMYGSSYRAINQMLTAALQPPALKAIFPIASST